MKEILDADKIIFVELERCGFRVSTDTRADLTGTVYFALRGETFDGNNFLREALAKGAAAVVTDRPENAGEQVHVVPSVLATLQRAAHAYRATFSIPIICIGGSNGKTMSKELTAAALRQKYKAHATTGSLNNHIGVPVSLLGMSRDTEIGIFEIGANHPGEHLDLLAILQPTHVAVTNNGMDHLEGFGSPEGARAANKEIYDWATAHGAETFVHTGHADLLEDSEGTKRVPYPAHALTASSGTPLTFEYDGTEYQTKMTGEYNIKNIELALAVGEHFGVETDVALKAICAYEPTGKRSQMARIGTTDFIIDCYNANPTSMMLSLDSFLRSTRSPRGVIIGDMLELGAYEDAEHTKIVHHVGTQELDCIIFIGPRFGAALREADFPHHWFPTSAEAREWFAAQDSQQKWNGYSFLLKGSRGMTVEKVLEGKVRT
jgi:UDP-N-acetylmuramoyl-tripeptide--D-alanyl-D-alanine ligase